MSGVFLHRRMPLVTGVSMFVTGFCYSMVVIAYMAALEPNEIETITGQAIALVSKYVCVYSITICVYIILCII